MNNNLKCRIWDKELKTWYEPIYEAYKGNLYELLLTTSGEVCRRTMNGIEHESTFPDRYEAQRFTGLADKNGTEIYEGDIIKTYINGECEEVTVVEFRDGGFYCLNFIPLTVHCDLENNITCEVIGNVFEHPHLLNQGEGSQRSVATMSNQGDAACNT